MVMFSDPYRDWARNSFGQNMPDERQGGDARDIFDRCHIRAGQVKLLLAVTLFALMTFVPRLAGLRH